MNYTPMGKTLKINSNKRNNCWSSHGTLSPASTGSHARGGGVVVLSSSALLLSGLNIDSSAPLLSCSSREAEPYERRTGGFFFQLRLDSRLAEAMLKATASSE